MKFRYVNTVQSVRILSSKMQTVYVMIWNNSFPSQVSTVKLWTRSDDHSRERNSQEII